MQVDKNKKNLAIIQARMGSSRLPRKVLLKIQGKTVLEHVVERVQKSHYIDEVVVATTIETKDLPIVLLCAERGIRVFCGSEDDVLDRYYQVAKLLLPDNVIRVTADCPLLDTSVLDRVLLEHMQSDSDYTSNTLEETFPDGLDCEVMKFYVLKEAWENAKMKSQREHVTQYMIHNEHYRKTSVVSEENYGSERWTLDTPQDYEFICQVYEKLGTSGADFGVIQILKMLNEHPELRMINQHLVRNEGLIASLKNDNRVDRIMGKE